MIFISAEILMRFLSKVYLRSMAYSFDQAADRSKTPSVKYAPAFLRTIFGSADVLPMWVADMEFEPAPFILEALEQRLHRGNLGYEVYADSLYEAVASWFARRHGWTFKGQDLLFTPNVVSALAFLLQELTEEGDGVIVQTPVYAPLFQTVLATHRKPVYNSLRWESGRYEMDFDAFRQMALRPENKVLLLCSPHNPVGRVWREEELKKLTEIAEEGNLFIISDEIHGDIVYAPHRHHPLLSLPFVNPKRVAVLSSPAKTFNIAGITRAFALIPDRKLRRAFKSRLEALFLQHPGALAQVAMEASYREGDAWVDELLAYLNENKRIAEDFLSTHCPELGIAPLEGTFLMWLDFSACGLKGRALRDRLVQKGKLGLNPGSWFGEEGASFMRMNIACPKEMLMRGLERVALMV